MNFFKLFLRLAVFCSLCLLLVNIHAGDETNRSVQTKNQKNNNIDTSKTTKKHKISKRGQVRPLKEFIPSEEVSADKPVAFPNDI